MTNTIKDTITIKTYLRPDFYEFFPFFKEQELIHRLRTLPFHRATLLIPKNIVLALQQSEGVAEAKKFFSSNAERQRAMLTEVLLQVGISKDITRAIGAIKREKFCPPNYEPYCYTNHSLFFDSMSCLSMPGLVGLMIERLGVEEHMKVLEIGIGSGYHAACISESLNGNCEVFGIEFNEDFFELGRAALEQLGYQNIHIYHGDGYLGWPSEVQFDRIYMTCSISDSIPARLIEQLSEDGLLQVVKAINKDEFMSEPKESWLRKTYSSYEQYFATWRSFGCLATYRKENGVLVEVDKLYDVRCVPFHRDHNLYGNDPADPFSDLDQSLKMMGINL